MLVAKESAPNTTLPLLACPLRYVRVWDDHGTGYVAIYRLSPFVQLWHSLIKSISIICSSKYGDLKILRPVAPAGYVALGDVAWPSHQSDPPLDYMRCVHSR